MQDVNYDIESIAKACDPKAKQYGNQWRIRCPNPNHGDKTPSCYLKQEGDHLLWHCHGCKDQEGVRQGIEATGLYTFKPSNDSMTNLKRGTALDRWRAELKQAIVEQAAEDSKFPASAHNYLLWAATLPPPVQLCGMLNSHSSGFIAAPGGSGKSMFSLGMAKHMAEGKTFCGWAIPKPLKVMMLDVEMGDSGLMSRLISAGINGTHDIAFDTSGLRDRFGMPRFLLGDKEHLQLLMRAADPFDVLFIDNVSACLLPVRGSDLFSPEAWQQVFELEQWARQKGKLLIFIDHTNKAGQLAGTLHKHRMADFVLLIERTSIPGEPWLEFLVEVDKQRHLAAPEDEIPRMVRLQHGLWTHSDPNAADDEVYAQVMAGTLQAKDAYIELGISNPTFTKRYKQYRQRLKTKQRQRHE